MNNRDLSMVSVIKVNFDDFLFCLHLLNSGKNEIDVRVKFYLHGLVGHVQFDVRRSDDEIKALSIFLFN